MSLNITLTLHWNMVQICLHLKAPVNDFTICLYLKFTHFFKAQGNCKKKACGIG